MRMLRWLAFSKRSLSADEIAEAAVLDEARRLAFDRVEVLKDPREALSIFSYYVSSQDDHAQPTIALTHVTIRDHLRGRMEDIVITPWQEVV